MHTGDGMGWARRAVIVAAGLVCAAAGAGCKSDNAGAAQSTTPVVSAAPGTNDAAAAARVNAKNQELLRQADHGDGARCRRLIGEGAEVNTKGALGRTPLHLSAMNGHRKCSAALITEGANVNAQDDNGDTPLHLCVRQAHDDTIRVLVNAGADKSIRNTAGKTPAEIADPRVKHLVQ